MSEWSGPASSRGGSAAGRVNWARAAVVAGMLICAARTAQWTIFEGEELAQRAESNFLGTLHFQGPRGSILDAHGAPLARTTSVYSVDLARYRNSPEEVARILEQVGGILGKDLSAYADAVNQARPRWKRIALARGLSLQDVMPLYERRPDLPGLGINEDRIRTYPLGRAAAHVVGYTGFLTQEELDKGRGADLPRNARVGRAGLERYYEARLRGEPGNEIVERDRRGRLRRSRLEQPGRPGYDLLTTLDSRLQQVAHDLLAGHSGVLLAMEAETGAILAAAVRPTFDPQSPGAPAPEGETNSFLDRAVMQHYPPGSPFKLATALAALRVGITPDARIYCRGYYETPDCPNRRFRDQNNPGGYGWINMADALKVSSNVYFYQTAPDIGAQAVLAGAALLGLDRLSGVDLPGEVPGTLGRLRARAISPGETILMGIGQGPLAVSPMQLLRATGAVATRGRLMTPHIGRALIGPTGREEPLGPWPEESFSLADEEWQAIVRGMYRVCNEEHGTAFKASFPIEWQVCGKTGTAERPPGEPDAWFVGFAPR